MLRRLCTLFAVALALTGCELRTDLLITANEDGGGTVQLGVGLDDDALALRPDLADELALDDLIAAGWEITGPIREFDGRNWIRASHDFHAPDQLGPLVDQLVGPDGPFRDITLEREDSFASSEYRFSGRVDFSAGIADAFADPELAEAAGAEPLELLEERLGAAVDRVVTVRVGVRLPGTVVSNAPGAATQAENGVIWQPSVLERDVIELRATGTVRRTSRLLWLGVAVAAGFAFVLFVLIRVALWWRRREQPAGP